MRHVRGADLIISVVVVVVQEEVAAPVVVAAPVANSVIITQLRLITISLELIKGKEIPS